MMKIFFMLLVALTATMIPLASAQAGKGPGNKCIVFYERSAALAIGNYNFTGSTTETDIGRFDTPFFYKLSGAESSTAMPDGRVKGFYSLSTSSGTWSFEFFATNSWITAIYGFGSEGNPNVVTGGTGCFIGITGTLDSVPLSNTGSFFILQWTICPQKAARQCSGKA